MDEPGDGVRTVAEGRARAERLRRRGHLVNAAQYAAEARVSAKLGDRANAWFYMVLCRSSQRMAIGLTDQDLGGLPDDAR